MTGPGLPVVVLSLASGLLAALAVTSCLYYVLALVAAIRSRAKAGHASAPRPPVSVLVPVSGKEPRLRANLDAILAALDARDELLVGAADASDPALETVHELARERPEAPLTVVAGSPSRATNRKVAALEALEASAREQVIVLVDSDVRLDRELLSGLVSPLVESQAGLSTALYRGVPAPFAGVAPRIEALTINTDFVPSVLVAHFLGGGLSFALGAANAIDRRALRAIGGFASLGEVLADDYELGRRVAAAGFAVRLAPSVVPIVQDSSWKETLARLLRWNRTVRVCRPFGYALTVVSHHGLAFSLGALGLALAAPQSLHEGAEAAFGKTAILAGGPHDLQLLALGLVLAVALVRLVTATATHTLVAGRGADRASLPLLPLRDLIGTALFFLAWTGRTVTWRASRFKVNGDGTLLPLRPVPVPVSVPVSASHGGS